ncbi:alpha-L-fucosidase [Actinopolymorpha alba]|uniref:alpha-L-fucosidase n=1 Tax=Actinopolymorpha alba TaxID=533267 RepID=UPI000372F55E|nr:alpha-L-fucosidase [Actinopolymorpha alba]
MTRHLTPTAGQLAWQRAGFGMFCHFGINTYFGKEWSDGTLPPSGFDPTDLDARQWVATAAAAGMKYVVLTAKHHDGFCLWQTDTTAYSVRSAPWRSGRGDVVEELATACADAGLGLGLYLSPWDRNAACYSDPAAYDDFYVRQLTELCTRYGPLFEVWFDGAGSEGRVYGWERIMAVVEEHQPGAMIFNMGRPTIRWVGNEDGLAADPCAYVVDQAEGDVGSAQWAGGRYLPPECDVPIRRHWFWQPDDLHTLKSLEHLLAIYYRSVGLGAGLLLNVPPDRRGRLDDHDRPRLLELAAELERRFGSGVDADLQVTADGQVGARLGAATTFDHLVLEEELADGQRVTGHEIVVGGQVIARGGTIGVRRFHAFPEVTADRVEVRLTGDGAGLGAVTAHRTGSPRCPALEEQPAAMAEKVDAKAP